MKNSDKSARFLAALKRLFFRRIIYFIGFILLWQIIFWLKIYKPEVFPSVGTILKSIFTNWGPLLERTIFSLKVIGEGMLIGLVGAGLLTAFAMLRRPCRDLVDSIVAIAHPLPGIALLPLIILWFGAGEGAIIFIIVHSVLWPMLLNTMSGFSSVPRLYRDFGANIGLNRIGLIVGIYTPSSLPNIYAGLRIGWARAWRALISAEMIFGTSGLSGLGWFINERKGWNDIPAIFAALVVIVVIGLLVEDILFNQLEKHTIKKWGMVS